MDGQPVARDNYLKKLIAFRDSDVIKVVTGIRRCGKSTLLDMMRSHLAKDGVPTVLPAGPFVIAAYVGIWLALAVYAFVLSRRAKRTERDLGALKQALVAREEKLER